MKMYFEDRSLQPIWMAVTVLIWMLAIPAGWINASFGSQPSGNSSLQHGFPLNAPEALDTSEPHVATGSLVTTGPFVTTKPPVATKPLNPMSLTDQAETGLRRALAAMATRQWSGGWGNGWNISGQVVWGEFRPIPHYSLTAQPPATPGIARIYLRAAEVLNDDTYLHHARLAQQALLAVQSEAGGFTYDAAPSSGPARSGTFDDDVTTGSLDFLIRFWQFTGNEADRQAILRVGDFLLESQYPECGGWPQAYPPRPNHYNRFITFNDGVMSNVITSLLRLHDLFGDPRYIDAARRGGECIIRLQGSPGEDIWGAQHDPETLLPASARAFEPVAYTASESRGVIEILIELYLATGDERFLEPIPKALAWYDANRLANDNWARFYEPGTMRPIYGDRDGEVYYRLEDISLERQRGYSWEGDYYPYSAKEAYDRIMEIGRTAYLAERHQNRQEYSRDALSRDVNEVLNAQHPDGWWTENATNSRYRETLKEAGVAEDAWELVWSRTFVRNAGLLLDFIESESGSVYLKKR